MGREVVGSEATGPNPPGSVLSIPPCETRGLRG